MGNLDLYEKFRVVPDEAKKPIKGGRLSGMTDINPMWRIKRLTEEFGPCGFGWYYTVTNKWTETSGNEIASFADIELYIKIDNEWSKPIPGSGGSKLATVEKSGIYVSDECYKMAITDALSVACKQLGIGADVYFQKDRTKYDAGAEQQNKPTPQLKATTDQKNKIRKICASHNIDVVLLYSSNHITEDELTEIQANQLLDGFKKKYGDE